MAEANILSAALTANPLSHRTEFTESRPLGGTYASGRNSGGCAPWSARTGLDCQDVIDLHQGSQNQPTKEPAAQYVLGPMPPQVQPGAALRKDEARGRRPDDHAFTWAVPMLG